MEVPKDHLDYIGKKILAPMVRIGTLPTRLLALRYGADLVYSEEIIDFKMLNTKVVDNGETGTVDFVMKNGTIVFQTHPDEKGKVVFQMGTSDAVRAVTVAKKLEKYVAAVDINMGCPKEFSIKGGMGAALLTQPEKVKDILSKLVKNLSIPVTCKIRVLPEVEDTLNLVKLIESTGVAAIGVHGRTKEEHPANENRNGAIRMIAESIKIPVIANGGSKNIIKNYGDIERFRQMTGAASVMIARAAQWNLSIFRPDGMLPVNDVIKDYLKLAIDIDNNFANIKYIVQQLFRENMETPEGHNLMHSVSTDEICDIWGLGEYCKEVKERRRLASCNAPNGDPKLLVVKKRKLDDGTELFELPLLFNRNDYSMDISPRTLLFEHYKKTTHSWIPPVYQTTYLDRNYHTVLSFDGRKYCSTEWFMNKKRAEQCAAAVCLHVLGLYDGRKDSTRQHKKAKHHATDVTSRRDQCSNSQGNHSSITVSDKTIRQSCVHKSSCDTKHGDERSFNGIPHDNGEIKHSANIS